MKEETRSKKNMRHIFSSQKKNEKNHTLVGG